MRLLPTLVIATAVAACADQQHPLTATAAASLKGRRVFTTARPPTPFFLVKAYNVFSYGLVAAAAESDAGARVLRENGIADPALYTARQLINDLQHRYGLILAQPALYIADDDPTHIAARHPAADLILDVWITWSMAPLPHDPLKYRVSYAANLRLIDAKVVHAIDGTKGLVIADGSCTHLPEETPTAPTYDQFLADGARRLKDELDLAARSCVEKFRSKVLTAGP